MILTDLETEVKAAIPSVDHGFDLGVLLATLVPASLVAESDTTWTFETLLRDVTDELTAPVKTVSSTSTTTKSATAGAAADAAATVKTEGKGKSKQNK